MPTIGILHPGDMGSVVGACAVAAGARVLWASEGRSAGTCGRAAAARLEDAGTVAALVAASDVILSVCPPHAALDLARDLAGRALPPPPRPPHPASPPTPPPIRAPAAPRRPPPPHPVPPPP